jgi:hypothetical protein
MIPIVAASSTLVTGSAISFFIWLYKYLNPKANPQKSIKYPCTIASGSTTEINLPTNGTCNLEPGVVQLVYMNPCGNPNMSQDIAIFRPNQNSNSIYTSQINKNTNNDNVEFSFQSESNGIQTQYCTMGLSKVLPFGQLQIPQNSSPQFATVNLCPQTFTFDNKNVAFAAAVPLPVFNASNPGSTNPDAWMIPGFCSAAIESNGINVPCTLDPNSTPLNSITRTGLATELYLIFLKDTTFYMELTGAYGGTVNVYTNGVDPTGQPSTVEGYNGGEPGIVYGLFTAKANDVIKFFLGSQGDDSTQWTNPLQFSFNGNGQGGLGTTYGGVNGGGPSYAVHYPVSKFKKMNATEKLYDGPLESALSNVEGTLICIAGGGGGSSRNASGGHAGLDNFNDPVFGQSLHYGTQNLIIAKNSQGSIISKTPKSVYGSTGSATFVTGPAASLRQRSVNSLSGGGGVLSIGGQSNVPNPIRRHACDGQGLQQFVGQSETSSGTGGGCATATDIGSGGGGGGGGLFGGGAGGYNGLAKPNNVHGAGGGGSSSFGFLEKNATGSEGLGYYSLNKFRDIQWPIQQVATETPNQKYGSLVLGWPV